MINLSFLILAHKNPEQLQLLVNYLTKNNCYVFIHIDKKNAQLFAKFIEENKGKPGVHIYTKYTVSWGGYTQIKATFFLLGEAIKKSPFDFVSLISGQDVPIKSISDLSGFLDQRRNSSFVHWYKVPAYGTWADNGGLDRVQLYWLTGFPKSLGFIFNRMMVMMHRLQRRFKFFKNWDMPLYGGTNWFTLNKEMAVYAHNYVKDHKGFFRKFRNTRCADEIILQTIMVNSPYRDAIINETLRFIDWETGPEFPRTFRMEDKDRLLNSDRFFARKFDTGVDKQVIEHLYSRI